MTGAAALALIVVCGTFAFARTLGETEVDALVADGSTSGGGLSVTVEAGASALTRSGLAGGEAVWNTTDGMLLYASRLGFSSSCPPEATLTNSDGSLSLQLASAVEPNRVCTADAVPVVVTITSLSTPPQQVLVTEEGNPPETVAVARSATSDDVGLPCPTDQRTAVDLDVPGPGQPTPEAAVALLLPQLGQLSVGSVKSEGRRATVAAVNSAGSVVRIYSLTLATDGWWPDGYSTCELQVP